MSLLSTAARTVVDWVKLGYPESVAKRIVSGDLPMDEASRLKRAEEQGYAPDTYYHGTYKGDIKEVSTSPDWRTNESSSGFYVTDNPLVANTYADDYRKSAVYPLRIKKGKSESYQYGGSDWGRPPEDVKSAGANTNDIAKKAFDRGADSVEFRDIVDVASSIPGDDELTDKYLREILQDLHGPDYVFNKKDAGMLDYANASNKARRELLGESNNVAVKDGSQVRSVNAAFDPQYTGRNILGGVALPATAGLLALAQSDDADAGFVSKGGKTLLEAWHGSPHKFDKFSMDQIGTGEGAQAYGHGLYFADDIDEAKRYQPRDPDQEEEIYRLYQEAEESGDQYMMDAWERAMLQDSPIELRASAADPDYDEYSQAAFAEVADYLESNPGAGSLLRAEIDVSPDQMIDWEKSIKDQPQLNDTLERLGYFDQYPDDTSGEIPGSLAYSRLFDLHGDVKRNQMLNDEGIRGISYPADNPTRGQNHVIFDDSLINIAERGRATPGMMAAVAGTAGGASGIAALKSDVLDSLLNYSDDRAKKAADRRVPDARTIDEQRIANHRREVNERMHELGMLEDPLYTYRDFLPVKKNIVTGERSLAVPSSVRGMIKAILDLGSTPRTGVYNPEAPLEII